MPDDVPVNWASPEDLSLESLAKHGQWTALAAVCQYQPAQLPKVATAAAPSRCPVIATTFGPGRPGTVASRHARKNTVK